MQSISKSENFLYLKLVLCNFMIFKGKDFLQYASNKQITFDKFSNPEKKGN